MKKKIFLYGGKSTSFLVHELLKEDKKKVSYIFDRYLKKPHFKYTGKFSNKPTDFHKFVSDSKLFWSDGFKFVSYKLLSNTFKYVSFDVF